MLVSNGAYEVSSNRESGLGRYDILLRPRDLGGRGFIMELKVYDPMFDESVDKVLDSALAQIEEAIRRHAPCGWGARHSQNGDHVRWQTCVGEDHRVK